jgi:hypothetical protein
MFMMAAFAGSTQTLLPVTIVTWSAGLGIPAGVQLVAVFQSVEVIPFQVKEVWDKAVCALTDRHRNNKKLLIAEVFLTE